VHSDVGRFDKAESAYQQSMAIEERLASAHPDEAEDRRALAKTQSGMGLSYFFAGRLDKAQASFEQALVVWDHLVANTAHTPEDRHGLAGVQHRLGSTYGEKGQYEKADAMLKEAASTYQALAHDYPEVPEYRHFLGSIYRALGGLYLNNMRRADKAEAAHEQARQIFDKLAKEHPDVLEFAHDVGTCYADLAMDAGVAGRLDAALTRSDKAIEILEPVLSRGYIRARGFLLDIRVFRASMLAGRGGHARATAEADLVARLEDLGVPTSTTLPVAL
jgi:tetratricopeptide (TPR) repeat protein